MTDHFLNLFVIVQGDNTVKKFTKEMIYQKKKKSFNKKKILQ
jgi:hypothetical protein